MQHFQADLLRISVVIRPGAPSASRREKRNGRQAGAIDLLSWRGDAVIGACRLTLRNQNGNS